MLLFLLPTALASDADLLMLGNSYTQQNDLPQVVRTVLLDVTATEDVRAMQLTRGGLTLADHAAMATAPGEWANVLSEDWDWVVLQDQSQVPGFPQDDPYWEASRDGAVILDELAQPAQVFFLLTWGRRDGDDLNPDRYPDFDTMQDHLTEGYLAYADAASQDGSPAFVAPAGWAWREVHQADVELFKALYATDGSHPSPTGTWLAALTVTRALTGRGLDSAQTPAELDEDAAEILRAAATASVQPFEELDYPWAYEWEEYGSPEIGDPITCPTVRLAEPAVGSASLVVGEEGCGRLWVDLGGSANSTTLVVGEEGELRVRGGEVLPSELYGGSVVVESGTVRASLVEVDSLELEEDGFLFLDGPMEVGSSWTPRGAVVVSGLEDSGGIHVDGDADLQGTLDLTDTSLLTPSGELLVLSATTIERGELTALLPPDTSLEVRDDGEGGRELWLTWGSPDQEEPEGCGCHTSPVWGWPLLLLPLLGLRRRTDQPG